MENKSNTVILTLDSGIEVNPEMTTIPILLLADRMVIEYIPPGPKIGDQQLLYKPVNAQADNFCNGYIASIGDSCDPERPIPESLKKLGLKVRYSKGYAEEIEYNKKIYHMIRWSEIAYIL